MLYLHNRQQRRDAWLRDFRTLHKEYWEDETFAEVRAWIANEQAYRAIVPILNLRRRVEQGESDPAGIPLEGAADHGVSEALYLRDPDCNGVELYRDRPPGEWPRTAEGGLAMYTRRLDLDDLLREVDAEPT